MVSWNDGLSLGVEALDNDHKKLLEIINRLSDCIEDEITEDVVSNIFTDLEEYGIKHFQREESFMKKCNYAKFDEHVHQHNTFVTKIPRLKEKLLKNLDRASIQEVSTFLSEWLINHIIYEDMLLINSSKKSCFTQKKEDFTSIFHKLVHTITHNISFSKRIFYSTLLPLLVMSVLGFIIMIYHYDNYDKMKKTSALTHIVHNVNELIHAMQIQRGLSSGHISAKDTKFKDSLLKQSSLVDKQIKLLLHELNTIDIDKLKIIKHNIQTFKEDVPKLKILEKKALLKQIAKIDAITQYTTIIQNILEITIKIASTRNVELSRYIFSLSSISHFKESLGLERAYGTIIIEQKSIDTQEYRNFIKRIDSKRIYLNMFEQFASQHHQISYLDILNSTSADSVYTYEDKILNNNIGQLDSQEWFKLTTNLINKIKILENSILDKIDTLIVENIDKNFYSLILWLIVISLTLSTTLITAYLFEYSNKKELQTFIEAMKHLADGKRDMKLKNTPFKDAMSHMYISYEKMRQKLLEGDIYTELFNKQKHLEIQSQKLQNDALEELASIDPLTGCVNRRKFTELADLELLRSLRYKNDLTFLMLDIDHFKSVNDTYGHAVGDEVLKHFSAVCLELARNIDVVARIGGEEFVVMLPNTNTDGAYIFAQRFREKIYKAQLSLAGHTIKYTVSIGISMVDYTNDTQISTILQRADSALYKAKDTGRNKCVIYS